MGDEPKYDSEDYHAGRQVAFAECAVWCERLESVCEGYAHAVLDALRVEFAARSVAASVIAQERAVARMPSKSRLPGLPAKRR